MAQSLAPWRVYDALYNAHYTPGFTCVGREDVLARIARTLQRTDVRHVIIVGPSGIGKTTVLHGLATALLERRFKGLRPLPVLSFDVEQLQQRLLQSSQLTAVLTHFEHALASLPSCLMIFDDIHRLLSTLPDEASLARFFSAITAPSSHQALLVFSADAWLTVSTSGQAWWRTCEVIELDEVTSETCQTIVSERARYIAGQHHLQLHADVPAAAIELAQRMSGTAQPHRTLALLEEVCAAAEVAGEATVSRADVTHLFAQRTGQTATTVTPERIRALRSTLTSAVIGQAAAVETVSNTIERAWLGLKNPRRPLGSFLFLGPSGVGKTELARVIAREVYGSERAFIRIDMSEYGQPHSVQRLIGAPPGYVGYEAGGQLTAAIQKQPFALILLDEIEKADSSVFDIFLQVLEDGRLTDGHGNTVDFRHTILIATSNLGVESIIAGWLRSEDITSPMWQKQHVVPALAARMRLEFINRFESVVTFSPLSAESLFDIAQLELQKIQQRLAHHHVAIRFDETTLRQKIAAVSDPRFGVRPLKRWLESEVEAKLAHHLLARPV